MAGSPFFCAFMLTLPTVILHTCLTGAVHAAEMTPLGECTRFPMVASVPGLQVLSFCP